MLQNVKYLSQRLSFSCLRRFLSDARRFFHFLYVLHLYQKRSSLILTGFSAGAHIASNVGLSANNAEYYNRLHENWKSFHRQWNSNHERNWKRTVSLKWRLYPKDSISKYEPIIYFDKNDPSFFSWHGGKDDQIPVSIFLNFVNLLNGNKIKTKWFFPPMVITTLIQQN